ncbi:IS66 family insertion sequence element accessory protein TnpB [Pseudomonas oryzae]|uniref:IS66 family insertion sequence element accessory protein TnpB n=1 Tax=Pseudomonas oryzae TaxID=1392877 RepID=UPI0038B56812
MIQKCLGIRDINGLSLCIQQALGRSPCDGSIYLFRNYAGTRPKLLQWDINGVWPDFCSIQRETSLPNWWRHCAWQTAAGLRQRILAISECSALTYL